MLFCAIHTCIIISLYESSDRIFFCQATLSNRRFKLPKRPAVFLSKHNRSESLPEPLAKLRLAELVQLEQTFFAQVHALHVGGVLCGWLGDSAGDNHRVGLEDDAVVDDLVDGERGEVVVLDQCALVDRISAEVFRSANGFGRGLCACGGWTHFRRMFKLSRNASTTLYSMISFSSAGPTTYSMTSLSVL